MLSSYFKYKVEHLAFPMSPRVSLHRALQTLLIVSRNKFFHWTEREVKRSCFWRFSCALHHSAGRFCAVTRNDYWGPTKLLFFTLEPREIYSTSGSSVLHHWVTMRVREIWKQTLLRSDDLCVQSGFSRPFSTHLTWFTYLHFECGSKQ